MPTRAHYVLVEVAIDNLSHEPTIVEDHAHSFPELSGTKKESAAEFRSSAAPSEQSSQGSAAEQPAQTSAVAVWPPLFLKGTAGPHQNFSRS